MKRRLWAMIMALIAGWTVCPAQAAATAGQAAGEYAVRLAAGMGHTVGLRADGTVLAVGMNE